MRRSLLIAVLLACAAIECIAGQAGETSVRDQRGVLVRLTQPARRIVSLLPSLTETVCALGQCDRLVGVDRYSNYPASVHGLPKVGGGLDPNFEAIVALRPDLVLTARSGTAAAPLQTLGLSVAAFEPQTHDDVHLTLEAVAQLLGVDGAPTVWARIQRDLQTQAARISPGPNPLRVYFEVNDAPFAAGPTSFIGQTLHQMGLANAVPTSMGAFPRISPEFIVRSDPDLVMIGDVAYAGLQQRPGWATLRALQQKRVCAFSAEQSDVLVRPGPRLAEGAALMVDCVRRVIP